MRWNIFYVIFMPDYPDLSLPLHYNNRYNFNIHEIHRRYDSQ